MYANESYPPEWPNDADKRESSQSSNEGGVIQTVVTAVIEPLPDERLKINHENTKERKYKQITSRKHFTDFDKIEICSSATQILNPPKRKEVNITRTLMQLNQNINNEVNNNQQFMAEKQKKIKLQNKQHSKKNLDYNKKEIFFENTQPLYKKQKLTKYSSVYKKEQEPNIRKATKTMKLKRVSTGQNKELYKLLQEINDLDNKHKQVEKLSSRKVLKRGPSNIIINENNSDKINLSIGSNKMITTTPRILDHDKSEVKSIPQSNLYINESLNNPECNDITRSSFLTTALSTDINSIIKNIAEALLYSLAIKVKTLLEVIHRPVNPSLLNLYHVLQQLNDELSSYLKQGNPI